MLLMSRQYALAVEDRRAEQLANLEDALLTPEELAAGKKLAPRPKKRVTKAAGADKSEPR